MALRFTREAASELDSSSSPIEYRTLGWLFVLTYAIREKSTQRLIAT